MQPAALAAHIPYLPHTAWWACAVRNYIAPICLTHALDCVHGKLVNLSTRHHHLASPHGTHKKPMPPNPPPSLHAQYRVPSGSALLLWARRPSTRAPRRTKWMGSRRWLTRGARGCGSRWERPWQATCQLRQQQQQLHQRKALRHQQPELLCQRRQSPQVCQLCTRGGRARRWGLCTWRRQLLESACQGVRPMPTIDGMEFSANKAPGE